MTDLRDSAGSPTHYTLYRHIEYTPTRKNVAVIHIQLHSTPSHCEEPHTMLLQRRTLWLGYKHDQLKQFSVRDKHSE